MPGPVNGEEASRRTVVLKFGSSLLDGPSGYRTAVEEMGREVALGHCVLAVVSARRGMTDELLRAARTVVDRGGGPAKAGADGADGSGGHGKDVGAHDPSLLARLLGTGEEASVALLGLAARAAGLRVDVLGGADLDLRTSGPVDDAEPAGVDVEILRTAILRSDVVIVPGFVGRDERGRPTHLGRGGSDYTALYLGSRIGAGEIRLVKDVDGVFERDPGPSGGREPTARTPVSHGETPDACLDADEEVNRLLSRASWDEVERLGGGVVQHKALRFAMREGLSFRVAAPGGRGTLVGPRTSRLPSDHRLPVAVLGATGIVGQQLVRMLVDHPWLRPVELVGSPRRSGERYGDVVDWMVGDAVPMEVRDLPMAVAEDVTAPVVLSALPSRIACDLELRLAAEGRLVCTNASAHRMRSDVPLLVPEVNAHRLGLLDRQPWRGVGGGLVANPNCVVTGLALALAPIERRWGLAATTVVTLQALSGAGAGGPSALTSAGNVVPHIPGEEEKIPGELRKILEAPLDVAVAVSRVPVIDGHTAHVFLRLRERAGPSVVVEALEAFRAEADVASLPSIPRRPLMVRREADRPQPRLDAGAGEGMRVSVGRIREAPPYDLALTLVVHNTVRGAAGSCLTNAELCLARRIGLSPRQPAPACS